MPGVNSFCQYSARRHAGDEGIHSTDLFRSKMFRLNVIVDGFLIRAGELSCDPDIHKLLNIFDLPELLSSGKHTGSLLPPRVRGGAEVYIWRRMEGDSRPKGIAERWIVKPTHVWEHDASPNSAASATRFGDIILAILDGNLMKLISRVTLFRFTAVSVLFNKLIKMTDWGRISGELPQLTEWSKKARGFPLQREKESPPNRQPYDLWKDKVRPFLTILCLNPVLYEAFAWRTL